MSLTLIENNLILLNEVWNPNNDEYLSHLLEDTSSKISDEEKRVVDGQWVLGIFEGCYFVPDGESENRRFYPKECWIGENGALKSKDILDKIASKTLFGTIGHEDKEVDEDDLRNQRHALLTYKLWIDPETNLGMGRSYILGTDDGRALYAPMRAGSKFKMSTRAKGSFKEGSFKESKSGSYKIPVVDPKTFKLLSVDVVFKPGFNQTSAILKENREKIEVRSIDMNEDLNTLTEAVKENAELASENKILKEKLSKVDNITKLNESTTNVISGMSSSDWEAFINTAKVKVLGESKSISHKKDGHHYDAVFIPTDLPFITEGRLKTSIFESRAFNVKPTEVAIIKKTETPEYGSNGLVLCWPNGSRPSKLQESLKKYILTSTIFESIDLDDDDEKKGDNMSYKDQEKDPKMKTEASELDKKFGMSDDDNDEDDKKHETSEINPSKKSSEEDDDDEDDEKEKNESDDNDEDDEDPDKKELKEWRELFVGKAPSYVGEKVMKMKDELKKYKEMPKNESENGSVNEKYMKFYEKAYTFTEGKPEKIFKEISDANKLYGYIKKNYESLNKLNETLAKSETKIKTLQEQLEGKNPSGNTSALQEQANEIAKNSNGKFTANEVLEITKKFKNINEAKTMVFDAVTVKKTDSATPKDTTTNLNESASNASNKLVTRTKSMLTSIFGEADYSPTSI